MKRKNRKVSKVGTSVILLPIAIASTKPTVKGPAQPKQSVMVKSPNDSIVELDGELSMTPDVPAMTQTIASAAGGGALATTCYFLNEDSYNVTPTNNGSGADSIVTTYGDGWSGKGYNQLAKSAVNPNGIPCFGFTLHFITTATGAENAAGLNTANPTWLMANLVGANMIPKGFVLTAGARNTQYLAGEMTVKLRFSLNCLNQISYVVPVGNTATLTVLTKPF